MRLNIRLNGKMVSCDVPPETPLLDTLRQLGLSSVRSGCDTGNCGICSVWLDGRPVLSCSVPVIRADGREVTTVEGVPEEAAAVAAALAREGADQCGYCAPGLIMTVLAMKRELQHPSDTEIAHYLNGSLCRCSGYAAQLRAIRRFFRSQRPEGG